MLNLKEVYFRHKNQTTDVLKGISFNAEKGSITTILGPNGSGKTTLFKCITGLWKYYKGEIKVDRVSIDKLSFKKRARLFSVVPQEHEPPFPYSVFDVVLMGRASYIRVFSSPSKKDYEKAETALKTVGIEHLKNIPYTKISGGERQLTLIARAIVQESPVMLLDEPISHLDFRNQINILKKIKEIALIRGITVVMTLHDPNLASLFSDKVVVINSGSKVAEGLPKEIITEDLIKRVYDIEVKKADIDGQSIICPVL
ncbi:MAG: ABC transporter ATP-binding protein [Thermodesulfovibrio sp.]|uniref:ABC transporter ATP-binding protein n=1 Tax=Thermodesulfovibrio sp. 1176 TaxID=3043424 RepID=UPI0024828D77|nr:ABC transporter ATP-binding protein [Thermodesulfovibrio sp. 1176]MDI1472579.1 ABC transporter ATP-binding protein [Thermodesulfovibrio sp. 1176]MDI6714377.1 ABC transporter ATP-binding protein [Thermodesulfovibrio sp.]